MEPDISTLLACARLLDTRFDETLESPFRLPRARIYGCDVGIGAPPTRLTFLAEHADVYALLAGPAGRRSRTFDAAVVGITGWGAPLDDLADGRYARPSEHPSRHRIRVCCAVGEAGVVSVMRSELHPGELIETVDPDEGLMPIALGAMWHGTPLGTGPNRSARRTAHAGRHRRP